MINKLDLDKYKAKPNKTIKEHTEDLIYQLNILRQLGYIHSDKIYNLIYKACIYHDVGKVNSQFQKRVNSDKKIKFDDTKEICHNLLSFYFIDKDKFENEQDYLCVAHAVLHHHNYGNVFDIINNKKELIKELLINFDTIKPKRKVTKALTSNHCFNDINNIIVKGLLHKCDYSASANYTVEYENNFMLDSLDSLNYEWNEMQVFCKNNQEKNIIAVASTGSGKTEAGLLWLANNKSFFILPIRTAINSMYDRIKDNILEKNNISDKIAILHSSSLDYYNKSLSCDEIDNLGSSDIIEYENRGKRFSIPFNISTMDQIFDFVFKYNSYELKLATLSYSKLVIDEIQMYQPELLAYLIYGVNKILDVGGKVSIITATLPPFVYDLLDKDKTRFVRKDFIKEDMENSKRHNVKVKDEEINTTDILDVFLDNKNKKRSNKVLVVCNTIKKCQEIYNDLKKENMFSDNELNILHSRFIKKERLEKEKEITKFGQTYIRKDSKNIIDNKTGIWISTSLVEASLDIDFDYLFTELYDLSSLFQRFGRVNRKGLKNNTEYNCYVYTAIKSSMLKSINNSKGFIDKVIFNLSKEAISEVNGLISEKQKYDLINKYLTTDRIIDSSYLQQYNDTYDFIENLDPYRFEKNEVKLRDILSETIIPSPVYYENKDIIDNIIIDYNTCINNISSLFKQSHNLNTNKKYNVENQNKLKLLKIEKAKLYGQLYDYTVDVPSYEVYNSIKNGCSVNFDIQLNDKKKFKVIECMYDKIGFFTIKEENIKTEAEFL